MKWSVMTRMLLRPLLSDSRDKKPMHTSSMGLWLRMLTSGADLLGSVFRAIQRRQFCSVSPHLCFDGASRTVFSPGPKPCPHQGVHCHRAGLSEQFLYTPGVTLVVGAAEVDP